MTPVETITALRMHMSNNPTAIVMPESATADFTLNKYSELPIDFTVERS